MELLMQYWDLVLIVLCALVGVSFLVYKYTTLPTSKKKDAIREILLDLVTEAEKRFGSKQGQAKFEFVYSMLSNKFIWFKYLPITVVEELIEESLQQMREMLEKNEGDK